MSRHTHYLSCYLVQEEESYAVVERVHDVVESTGHSLEEIAYVVVEREELTGCSRDEILSIMKSCVGSSTRPTP